MGLVHTVASLSGLPAGFFHGWFCGFCLFSLFRRLSSTVMTLSVPSVGSGRRGSTEVRLVLSLMNKRQMQHHLQIAHYPSCLLISIKEALLRGHSPLLKRTGNWSRNASRNCFWDCCWGARGTAIGQLFFPVPCNSPRLESLLLVSKVEKYYFGSILTLLSTHTRNAPVES